MISNASFEQGKPGAVPEQWGFTAAGDAKAAMVVTDQEAKEGKRSLKVTNLSPKKSNVFGSAYQMIKLEAGKRYTLSAWIKGKSVKRLIFIFGNRWRIRFSPRGIDSQWKKFTYSFTADKKDFRGELYPLRINIDDTCEECYIDDLSIVPYSEIVKKLSNFRNGSFEDSPAGQPPAQWHFSVKNGAKASMVVVDGDAHDGKKALKITNSSPRHSNVFGEIFQNLKLVPGMEYTLSAWIKGTDIKGVQFVLGRRWKVRRRIRATSEWKLYSFNFTASKEDFYKDKYPIRILSENICKECFIDNITITPKGSKSISQSDFQKDRVYLLKPARWNGKAEMLSKDYPLIRIPQNNSEYTGKVLPAPDDLSGCFAFAYCKKGLIFTAKVTDDKLCVWNGSNMWRGDSIQLAVDQKCSMVDEYGPGVLELTMGIDKNGKGQAFCTQLGELSSNQILIEVNELKDGYVVAALLKRELLNQINFDKKKPFSFNIVLNENDGNERTAAFLAQGIHKNKSSKFNTVAMFQDSRIAVKIFPKDKFFWKDVSGQLLVCNRKPQGIRYIDLKLTDSKGKVHTQQLKLPEDKTGKVLFYQLDFTLPLSSVAAGDFTVEAMIDSDKLDQITGTKNDVQKQLNEFIADTRKFLDKSDKQVKQHYGNQIPSRYLTVPMFEIERQLTLLENDINRKVDTAERNFYLTRGQRMKEDIEEAVRVFQKSLSKMTASGFSDTWLYKTSPVKFDNGWFKADCVNEQGTVKNLPVLFTGYGHFGDVVKSLPYFNKVASDIIQIEVGTRHFVTETGVNRKILNSYLFPAMKKALDNNVVISLLLSPHYTPHWFLKKHPGLKRQNGFMKYEVNAPESKELDERYFRSIVRELKKSKYSSAIQSICITNEPVYLGFLLKYEFTRKVFIEFLSSKYKTIDNFNGLSGNSFKSFDTAVTAGLENKALKYEFYTFQRKYFGDWHKWLADIVREEWPGMPVYSKIMVFSSISKRGVRQGVDLEQFAEFSDLNGNDNFMRSNDYSNSWVPMSLSHDMQMSMKRTSIMNAENHIISDGEKNSIPFDHIYNAVFQQYMQGAGGIITWVWADNNYQRFKKDAPLRNNIFRRANSIIAQAYACLDANRIAGDIIEFCKAEPKVALLYSPVSYIMDTINYCDANQKVYTTLSSSGYKLGYLSEKQLEANKFGKVKVLFIPSVAYTRTSVLAGLKKFAEAGGTIVEYGDCFKFDQYGQALKSNLKSVKLGKEDLYRQTQKLLAKYVQLPVKISCNTVKNLKGIQYRSSTVGDFCYINLVNYTDKVCKLKLSGANTSVVELISGNKITGDFELKPLKPVFIKIKL